MEQNKRKDTLDPQYCMEAEDDFDSDTYSNGFSRLSSLRRKMTSSSSVRHSMQPETRKPTIRSYIQIGILFVINLLNYMDRYTVAGVLTDIQDYYDINDAEGGLLQTIFIATFIMFSPLCGYLGDRYNRKWIMVCGITIWLSAVFASSFIPKNAFVAFLIMRGIVGVGEASYAIISPSIIADMFTGQLRSRMFMLFYFAIPVGSGMGYMVGSTVAAAFNDWKWGIRITGFFGVICLAAIILFVQEPERGALDVDPKKKKVAATTYWQDLKSLLHNRTYVTATVGYTAVVFVAGTLSWWVPTCIEHSYAMREGKNRTSDLSSDTKGHVALTFGAITVVAGIVGVTLGTVFSQMLRTGKWCLACVKTNRSDPIICAIGAAIAAPLLFLGLRLIDENIAGAYVAIFFTITGLCFNWAINVDMLMATVIPSRRNVANSWQILISHLCGDGSGPYIIGAISDGIRAGNDSPRANFDALITAFYLPNAFLLLSAIMFASAALFYNRDVQRFADELYNEEQGTPVESLPSKKSPSSGSTPANDNTAYDANE